MRPASSPAAAVRPIRKSRRPGSAADAATAWKDVHYERSVTTWLEGRHLWDSSRWFNESGPAHSDAIAGRDQCLPVSKSELDANRNLTGYTVTHPLARQ